MAKVLVGFMGAGKTTVAKQMDPNFVDMDREITNRIGMPIATYFEKNGETAFRQIESQVLSELINQDIVLSTGGGVIESQENRELLTQNGEVIYLKADLATLISRIQSDTANKRPLYTGSDPESFARLYARRVPFYEAVADQVIDVCDKTPKEIVELIQ